MIEQVKFLLFILSSTFILRYFFEFLIKFFFINDPKPIVIKDTKEFFIYLSISYIITFFYFL
jgi:hypothetical protein